MDASNRFGRTLWERLRSGRLSTTYGILGALTVGILAGSLLTGSVSAKQQTVNSSDARPIVIPSPVTLSNGFSAIVKEVGPAVVNINTESVPKQQKASRRGPHAMPNSPDGDDDNSSPDQGDMQDFFNHFFGGQGPSPDMGSRRALGSGYIVDPRGYIITNDHVIDGADHIYVKLASDPQDGDQGRPATVVGFDKATDIAVIKIDPKGETLPTVKLGNSDGAQVGDWVLAIGSPFGLSQTVSAGIVSAKNREVPGEPGPGNTASNQFQRFIQTDAAINPGNSGGPLVNMAGQVIGMNTAIYTQSAGSEGVGFAMPSNTIAEVYNQLIGPEHKVVRGSIGITFMATPSSAVSRVYGFSRTGGVIVSSIVPSGPAAKAGLMPQDIITSIDGKPIKDGDELVAIISAKHPGQTVRLGVTRGSKTMTVDVGISDRDKIYSDLTGEADNSSAPADNDAGQSLLGITVRPTSQQAAARMKIAGGVTVTSVKPGSFAENIGLAPGLVITEINRHPVTDEASYRAIVNTLKSGMDAVFVVRDPQSPTNGNTYLGGTLQ